MDETHESEDQLWQRTAARLHAFAPRLLEAGWASRVLIDAGAIDIEWTPAGREKFGQLLALCDELGFATFQGDDMFALWTLAKLQGGDVPPACDGDDS